MGHLGFPNSVLNWGTQKAPVFNVQSRLLIGWFTKNVVEFLLLPIQYALGMKEMDLLGSLVQN